MTADTDLTQDALWRQAAADSIGEVLLRLKMAFGERDANALGDLYLEDADWTNAFGTTLHGRDAIVSYTKGLLADENFAAGRPVGPPQVAMRFVTSDVAVVKVYMEIQGQQTTEGAVMPPRRNHSLKVLRRQRDGRWLIVSEIYMDARDERTYVGS